ncbi:MAG: hypothetical protein FWH26_10580, partial [Oscillospiraceae bacterium]|nr:hypothetical protein [Oscillospiraceae bacterium]
MESIQPATVEQYKQQMLALGKRQAAPLPAAPPPGLHTQQNTQRAERLERVEEALERAEPMVEKVIMEAEPFARTALRSGLVAAGTVAAIEGAEWGVRTLVRNRREREAERQQPAPVPVPVPVPAPPAVGNTNTNINQITLPDITVVQQQAARQASVKQAPAQVTQQVSLQAPSVPSFSQPLAPAPVEWEEL